MKSKYLNRCIVATAVALLIGGAAHASDDPAQEVDEIFESQFVSALDAGVTLPEGTTLSDEDKEIMSQITAEQFQLLMDGQSPAAITTATGGSLDDVLEVDEPAVLGSQGDNLVYTAIEPCRVIDTGVAGGSFLAGETRRYTLGGKSNFTVYGGSNGVCTLPGSEGIILTHEKVRAYALNIVAASPVTGGNLQVWPANKATPSASTLNFQKLSPNLNIANGVIVKNCDDTGGLGGIIGPNPLCPTGDIAIKANFSGVRVVVDVVGYFTRAETEVVKSWVSSQTATADVDLTDKSCHSLVSCGRVFLIIGDLAPAGKFVVTGSANFDATSGVNDAKRNLFLAESATACNTGSNPFGATLETKWAGSLIDKQLNVQGVFSVAANEAKRIYLNASVAGDISSAHINSSSITCTFIPN